MVFQNDKGQKDMHHTQSDVNIANRIRAEMERFLSYVFAGRSLSLADFLDSSGEYFDRFVIETRQKEQLTFVGGKLILTPESAPGKVASKNSARMRREVPKNYSGPCSIQITANLYFQDTEKEWVMKTVQKHITSDSIKDWDAAPELEELRAGNAIEFPIDPPDEG